MKTLWKKIFLYTLAGLLLLVIAGGIIGIQYFKNDWFKERPNYIIFQHVNPSVAFKWGKHKYENYTEPHDAMIVPIKIKGLPHQFYMQFDTGSPFSFINKKPFESLKEYGLDYHSFEEEDLPFITNVELLLGENVISSDHLRVRNNGSTIDFADTSKWHRLGTLGTDIMADKITVIDFVNNTIEFYEERPAWMANLSGFQDFDFRGRRFMLPASIQGKEMELFYDSGSSAFGLLTSKNRFDAYTDPEVEEINYSANSHGKSIPVHHKPSDEMMLIGNEEVSLNRISYVEWHDKWQGFFSQFTKIGGFIGNKPFLTSALILDTQQNEFLVLKNKQEVEANVN
ncbi:MAG: hypothetical protein AAFO07_23160 [Bacteroidota bacterium]